LLSVEIGNILRDAQVQVHYYDIVVRERKFESTNDVRRSILVVSDATLPGQREIWRTSAMKIRKLLVQRHPDVTVEFMFSTSFSFPSFYDSAWISSSRSTS
jgi:hypothetical protein